MKSLCCYWIATATVTTFLTTTNGWVSVSPWTTTTPSHIPRSANDANTYSAVPPGRVRIRTTELCDAYTSNAVAGRRDVLAFTAAAIGSASCAKNANALGMGSVNENQQQQQYALKFPTLFAPLYGEAYRKTIKRPLGGSKTNTTTTTASITNNDDNTNSIWALEQNLELGPLQTPVRCTVIRLNDGTLWVHAPLAPTQEFFDLVESCATGSSSSSSSNGDSRNAVAHVVVPTYALEHKVFVKDALQRWPNAQLWTSPGQFSFPFAGVSDEFVFGKAVSGVLDGYSSSSSSSSAANSQKILPPWSDEIEYASLEAGTFNIGGKPTTLCETAFFHKASKSLIVTDAVARIPISVPPLNDSEQLLLISKRSTSDPMPEDTPQSRLDGWEKTALLVSYFFPEHEELDPQNPGVVTWTEGWHDNFNALAGRLIVPPVVRTLIYAQNPARVQQWVDQIVDEKKQGWDFEQIIPAHFEAPIAATPKEFAAAFQFLQDDTIDAFPTNDLARGLKPIADIALKRV
jgi:hypothetical protein